MSRDDASNRTAAVLTMLCAVVLMGLTVVQAVSLGGSEDGVRMGEWVGIIMQSVVSVVLIVIAAKQLGRRQPQG